MRSSANSRTRKTTKSEAHNAAEYLDERRRMMQAYADKLDMLRSKARVRRVKAAA